MRVLIRLQLPLKARLDNLEDGKVGGGVAAEADSRDHLALVHLRRGTIFADGHAEGGAVRQEQLQVHWGLVCALKKEKEVNKFSYQQKTLPLKTHMFVLKVGEKLLHYVTLANDPHCADLLQVELQPAPSTVQLLVGQRKGPLPRQLGKLKIGKFPLEVAVQGKELPVATGAEVPPRHVHVEDDVAFSM